MMMQVLEPGGHPPGVGGGAAAGWARPCDACRSTACSVYCRFEALYLCGTCDRQAHATDLAASRHERVWVCEACGRAPATLTCKADAAALCTACDADVHSANPLTRRHHRLPIVPIEGAAGAAGGCWRAAGALFRDDDEEEAGYHSGGGNGYHALFGGEVDEYLDLAGFNSCTDEQNLEHHQQQEQMQQQQQHNFQDYEAPEHSSVSLNHSVSVSSMEASVVPDGSSAAGPDTYTSRGTPLDLFPYPQHHPPSYMAAAAAAAAMMPQFTHPAMDREARVLRYREKRKMRKFEKTIRYASRKAYAETRPRIKGRFAKRSVDVEIEVDQLFSPSVLAAAAADTGGYGVVPSY